ncbi:MAG: hypothetical protein EPN82_16590 [Bacteroidetes bacterium]|nr:MAG: hypothetical protein EPN82_16590 [Bacteroidota bacterium]
MSFKFQYIVFILFLIAASVDVFPQAYTLDNTGGRINNNGTIKLKWGQVKNLNDTMGGRFEFLEKRNSPGIEQAVPTIVFNQLVLRYIAKKYVDSLQLSDGRRIPLTTMDSLIVADSVPFEADRQEVNAHASVFNNSRIYGSKDVRLNGNLRQQDIEGNGQYSNLNIDNPQGADIIRGGGFKINSKLELTNGELRNSAADNFNMVDSTWIVRHINGSLRNEPVFEGHVSVKYTGNGSIANTTGEIPTDSTKLLNLRNETTQGITITRNIVVNDTLYLKSPIRTEPDSNNKFILTLTTLRDPFFDGADAEIDGSFRRTLLHFDSLKIIFNNPYTWALFPDSASSFGMKELTFRIKPRTFPPIIGGDMKVKRVYQISALDGNFIPIDRINMDFGYGWRHTVSVTDTLDETQSLRSDFISLQLQKWDRGAWTDLQNPEPPQLDNLNQWAYSKQRLYSIGEYGVGLSRGGKLELSASLLLEGPYRFGSMAEDLRIKNLLPLQPPNIYPYNLDPDRQFTILSSIPDSVVDYIVIEFRRNMNDPNPAYRTCLLKMNGDVVDLDGKSPVVITKAKMDAGDYYIVVRHRNHLSIATENPVGIYPRVNGTYVDFTDPQILLGRANAVKPLGKKTDGSLLFGMIAGDVNNDGIIDNNDFVLTWDDRDYEGYLTKDINLSGIVNTRDLNFSWNNRGRSTLVP